MGTCASSQNINIPSKLNGSAKNWPSTAKVIHLDGRLQEFSHPITARHVIAQNPNCFLCSSEAMDINSRAPHVPMDEELQLGQIYFLMPLSKSHKQLSLQDLGALAIKASTTLNSNIAQMERTSTEITESPFSNDNIIVSEERLRIPFGMNLQMGKNQIL